MERIHTVTYNFYIDTATTLRQHQMVPSTRIRKIRSERIHDKDGVIEEPDEMKVSRPVLKER